ncbi:hypothetical protein L6R52_22630 [Myxococcota bacterium]|nr:hypothetical protein [Myxococcota bacterium]
MSPRSVSLGMSLFLLGACLPAPIPPPAPAYVAPLPEGLDERIRAEGASPNGAVDHFAVLIGAHTELRHRGNLAMAYQVLLEQGYHRDAIYILDSEGETVLFPSTDFTTRRSVLRLFEHLAAIVEAHDTLLVYVTGHGRRVSAIREAGGARTTLGLSTLALNPREELGDWELARLFERLSPELAIGFFDQCYSASFARVARGCRFAMITTAGEEDTSYGVGFPRAFWGALRDRSLPGAPLSVGAAFERAKLADRGTQTGANRPSLTSGCVDPATLTILGRDVPIGYARE